VLISVYDAYAVWKSKHMVKLAEFQKTTDIFAGFYFPYGKEKKSGKGGAAEKRPKIRTSKKRGLETSQAGAASAILGGGDIAFPLLFSGAVMKATGSYLYPIIITITTTTALLILLVKASKGKFYPAMPFLSAGCFAGLLAGFLISLI